MKSIIPWLCLLAASASQQVFAEDEFSAYRLGNYHKAVDPLINQTGKDAVANYYLGRLNLYGYGQLKNNSLAIRYFTKSAEKGYLPAILFMAKYCLLDEKNSEQAARWFKQAAAAGDVNSQLFMAAAYLYGLGVKKNSDAATHYFIDAAKNGNALAQFALAENFIDSKHSSNAKLGLIWLSKAAANGNPNALTRLGNLYISGKLVTKDMNKGIELLNTAAAQNYAPAMVELARVALLQNEHEKAVDWFNKAAKTGSVDAKRELANIYQKGIGVSANEALAKQWMEQANQDEKKQLTGEAIAQAALWLSNGATNKMEETAYQMTGILGAWKNPNTLRDNSYNQAPQLDTITRQEIFKPQFELVQPNEIPINNYYDALVSKQVEMDENQWTYPFYQLNHNIEALNKTYSMVVTKSNLPAPYLDANYDSNDGTSYSLEDIWTPDWQQRANYMTVISQLYTSAILGNAQSQFEIGQLFQYGIGFPQNDDSAIVFYQNAAESQHLGAEYNLGILYLEHGKNASDYQTALNWLTDAAFKGSKRAQYVLARVLEQGRLGPDKTEFIKPDHQQALSMLYLSAANNYGPAEYELAEHIARDNNNGLSVDVRKQKIALIRKLYQGAAEKGVAQALLPLAYYNAMADEDKQKQAKAFTVAESEAQTGDERAALLLGMLYDRGVGVSTDPAKAMYWYQKAGSNPVSQFIVGTYTAEGREVAQNKEKAEDLLNQSASAQFSYANFNLAVLKEQSKQEFLPDLVTAYRLGNSHAGIVLADSYLAENNDPEKMNQAKEIYSGLAAKGDQFAQLKLAYMLENGLGALPDYVGAQRWYTASAEQGNSQAQYLLGQLYQIGYLGEPDYALAKQWYEKASSHITQASVALGFIYETVDDNDTDAFKLYEKAASNGDPLGAYNLGLMYEYGKGVSVDYQKAKELYIKAADRGIDAAMNQLGGMYFYGLGQARNDLEALSWYKKAAELGNANAMYALGLFSETGVATKLDYASALKYYQDAAQLGNEKAMLAMARMYRYGLGIEKNVAMSADIYQKLSARQNAYAQYQLGTYYLEGVAGEQSIDKGRQLLEQASKNGSLQARKLLQRLQAQTQERVSYLEPVQMNDAPKLEEGNNVDLLYLNALNEWNRGDELLSQKMLQRLVTQYPNYAPARRAYEQLKQSAAKAAVVNAG